MRLIQAGTGVRGRHWLDFIARQDATEIVACVDIDNAALEKIASDFGCQTFTDFHKALTSVEADGVLVASPSGLHGEHSRMALKAGLAVMVEKPLAATFAEAVDIVKTAREVNLPIMVAENYRFFRAERTMRKLLDDGKVGNIRSVSCVDRRDQPAVTQGAWVQKMPQPFLTEIAVHHFDSFRYLFNRRPKEVWAKSFNPPGSDYSQNGAVQAFLDMEGELTIQYSGSFVGSRYEYDLLVYGDAGELRTNRNTVWWRASGEASFKEIEQVEMPEGEELRYPEAGMFSLLSQFRDAIKSGSVPETCGADNLWTLAMYEAAIQSANSGKCVSIDDTFTDELRTSAGLD